MKIPIRPQLNVRKEIAFTLDGGMLFLFDNMIVYVRQRRKDYKQQC